MTTYDNPKVKKTIPKKKQYSPILEVKLTRKNATSEGFCLVQEYLVRFGYLKHASYTADKLDKATSEALSKFQERFRLQKTGMFDENTRNQMGASRCGLPDMRLGIEFLTSCCWKRRNETLSLTFAFNNGTNDIAGSAEFQAVRNAFQTWAAVIPFAFTEVNADQNPDVLIDWRPANDPWSAAS
jgi:Putative peptidoglycan binding domain/Matrixin